MENITRDASDRTQESPTADRPPAPDFDSQAISQMNEARQAGSNANQFLGNLEITGQGQAGQDQPGQTGAETADAGRDRAGQAGAQADGDRVRDYCLPIPNNPADLARQIGSQSRDDLAHFGTRYGSGLAIQERITPGYVDRVNDQLTRSGVPRVITRGQNGFGVGDAMIDPTRRRF